MDATRFVAPHRFIPMPSADDLGPRAKPVLDQLRRDPSLDTSAAATVKGKGAAAPEGSDSEPREAAAAATAAAAAEEERRSRAWAVANFTRFIDMMETNQRLGREAPAVRVTGEGGAGAAGKVHEDRALHAPYRSH